MTFPMTRCVIGIECRVQSAKFAIPELILTYAEKYALPDAECNFANSKTHFYPFWNAPLPIPVRIFTHSGNIFSDS